MNRIALALTTAALFVCGCNQEKPAEPTQPEPVKAEVHKADAAKPPVVAKAPKLYFEKKKDGKVYVTDKVATVTAINEGHIPTNLTSLTGPNGETILISADSVEATAGLASEYSKQHPKK